MIDIKKLTKFPPQKKKKQSSLHQKNQNSPKKIQSKKKHHWEKALDWHECFDKGEILLESDLKKKY